MSNHDLDLLIVESNCDFIAVEKGYCKHCVEKKLETKIIRNIPISGKEYIKMKKDGLKGYKANCECKK